MGGTHDGGLYDAILAEQAKGNAFKASHNKEIQRGTSQPTYIQGFTRNGPVINLGIWT